MFKEFFFSVSLVLTSLTTIPINASLEQQISEEEKYGQMEYLAIIVYAEAGNQDLDGMRLVADVVLNRVDSDEFPDTVYDVIYQPGQFGPAYSGGFEKAAWNVSEDAFKAAEMEWDRETRLDQNVLYFNTTWDNGANPFKHGDHWLSY